MINKRIGIFYIFINYDSNQRKPLFLMAHLIKTVICAAFPPIGNKLPKHSFNIRQKSYVVEVVICADYACHVDVLNNCITST